MNKKFLLGLIPLILGVTWVGFNIPIAQTPPEVNWITVPKYHKTLVDDTFSTSQVVYGECGYVVSFPFNSSLFYLQWSEDRSSFILENITLTYDISGESEVRIGGMVFFKNGSAVRPQYAEGNPSSFRKIRREGSIDLKNFLRGTIDYSVDLKYMQGNEEVIFVIGFSTDSELEMKIEITVFIRVWEAK